MRLLSVSPNARSIEYQCTTCNKKMRAAACSTDAQSAKGEEERLLRKVREYTLTFRNRRVEPTLIFSVPEDLLPYEYSAREPIPESMRTEVWRRDNGCCVTCGSRVNLEFDHIIPVSKGGATTARNLQLLCQQCNRSKALASKELGRHLPAIAPYPNWSLRHSLRPQDHVSGGVSPLGTSKATTANVSSLFASSRWPKVYLKSESDPPFARLL